MNITKDITLDDMLGITAKDLEKELVMMNLLALNYKLVKELTDTAKYVQKIFDEFGKGVILCGLRTLEWDQGVKNRQYVSYHTQGRAVDIYIPGVELSEVANWAKKHLPPVECIIYEKENFIHLAW